MSTDRRMDKQNVIDIYNEILLGLLKGKGILTYVTTWVNLEDTMLYQIRHHKKTNTVFHLYEVYKRVIFRDSK